MTNRQILDMGAAVREVAAENSYCFLWVTTATAPLGDPGAGGLGVPLRQVLLVKSNALRLSSLL